MKQSFDEARKDEKHIQNHSLHGVESHITAQIGVSDDEEVETKEDSYTGKGGAGVDTQERGERLNCKLCSGELEEEVSSILDAIEEREEVA